LCLRYDIGYNNVPLAILCHVVYATLGLTSTFPCHILLSGAGMGLDGGKKMEVDTQSKEVDKDYSAIGMQVETVAKPS
jgi:hypothetical protein